MGKKIKRKRLLNKDLMQLSPYSDCYIFDSKVSKIPIIPNNPNSPPKP